jgi:hypothetical protein
MSVRRKRTEAAVHYPVFWWAVGFTSVFTHSLHKFNFRSSQTMAGSVVCFVIRRLLTDTTGNDFEMSNGVLTHPSPGHCNLFRLGRFRGGDGGRFGRG